MTDEENPFGGLFGDPDELQRRLGEFSEQMQGAQRVAWADNAIKLAVDMTVAAIESMELSGPAADQAAQVRDAIRLIFPEAVTLVREAREGLA
jgi:Ethanolamine utilization protein EutJ (predicted chaperonin)